MYWPSSDAIAMNIPVSETKSKRENSRLGMLRSSVYSSNYTFQEYAFILMGSQGTHWALLPHTKESQH